MGCGVWMTDVKRKAARKKQERTKNTVESRNMDK